MITNNSITYFKKGLDSNKLTKWDRYYFDNVWVFGGKGSSINKGFENANDVNVRIPLESVTDTDIFKIGDIIAIGDCPNISRQTDLLFTEFYNVTSISINTFGNNPHIHLGGK